MTSSESPALRDGFLPGEVRAQLLAEVHAGWLKYRSEIQRCRRKPKPARIRRARRLGRDLLARVDLLAALDDAEALDPFRRRLARQVRALGPVRDADVHAALLADGAAPADGPCRKFRRAIAADRRRAARRAVAGLKLGKLGRRLREALRGLNPPPAPTHAGRIAQVLAAALADARRRRPAQPVSGRRLHRARGALRHYRGLLGSLASFLTPSPDAPRLRREQRLMGEIHDLDTLIERWTQWTRARRLARLESEPLAAALRTRRARRLARLFPGAAAPSVAQLAGRFVRGEIESRGLV
jgi:CHAD domain-containing protein